MSETLPETGGDVVEPVESTDAAPEWSGVTQDDWTQTQQLLEQQQQALGAIVQALTPQEQQQGVQVDPFADNFGEQLAGLIRQELTPFQQFQQEQQLERGEAQATQMLTEIVGDKPFLIEGSAQKARELANTYFASLAQQHGSNPQVAKAALEQAVKDVRDWEEQVGKAYYEREVDQIRGITGARQEPGANQTGASQQITVTPGGPYGVLQKYTGQRH